MSQVLTNPPASLSAPSAPVTEAIETVSHKHRRLDLAKIALFYVQLYQWSYRDQQEMSDAIFAAMRSTFLARWAALGLIGVPLAKEAAARLRKEATTQAAQIARTHNAALAKFIGEFTHSYITQHPDELYGTGDALRAAIQTAVREWVEQRSDWKPGQIAGQTTRLALSLADLYAGGDEALYTVEGPALTDRSCGVCRAYYHQVFDAQQAWQLVFPAHPHCEHTMRQLDADERAYYELAGELL